MIFSKTVQLEPKTSTDQHHKVTFGTASYPTCNYWERSKIIKSNGKDILTIAHLYFPANTVINFADKITLNNGKSAPVVLIHPKGDTVSDSFLSVYLGGN
jgi:hypothetical protein